MSFDGNDDEISLPDLNLSAPVSVTAWIKIDVDDMGDRAGIVSDSATGLGWFLSYEWSNGQVAFGVNDSGGANAVTPEGTINVGKWRHVVGVFRGDTEEIWVDGKLHDSEAGKTFQEAGNESIGYTRTYFDGKIAHVRIWDYPLPETSIKALYNASKGGFSESDSRTL